MYDKDKIHGGDIYRNLIELDFSVNLNPLGIPEAVKVALLQAVDVCNRYPDPEIEKLKKAVAKMLTIPEEYLLFGNGASELFMAVVHGIQPKEIVIPIPSFYGYEYAAGSVKGKIVYYQTKREEGFCITEDIYQILTKEIDLLFLANPNNPTGNRINKKEIQRILQHCKEKGIYVVLDECFIEFCGQEFSMLSEIEQFENLILIRTFTKIFSIPGVRLGYLLCYNPVLRAKIQRQLSEWNLSCFAQAAGCACAKQMDFVQKTASYIKKEREFLERELKQMGFSVFPSEANFLLFYSREPLYEKLLKKGILIRDCRNFRGLSTGFYRVAIKNREENERLLEAIGKHGKS